MRALFYDNETSGFPEFNKPSEDPGQPHIVQLAALLVDLDSSRIIHTLDVIIRPDGWTIPDEAIKVHGITTEYADQVGVSEKIAVAMLLELWDTAETRVAHNEAFDARIIRIALMRHANQQVADEWKAARAECTQVLSTPIVKAAPTDKMRAAGRHHYKSANLREAYEFFTGRPLVDAHTAMADCMACYEVYKAIKAGQKTPAPSAVKAAPEAGAPKPANTGIEVPGGF